jgi:hypothetical protein
LERLASIPAVVPQIWPVEVGTVLVLATRKGRLTADARAQSVSMLEAQPVHGDYVPPGHVMGTVVQWPRRIG